jgi:hypothetical protein
MSVETEEKPEFESTVDSEYVNENSFFLRQGPKKKTSSPFSWVKD